MGRIEPKWDGTEERRGRRERLPYKYVRTHFSVPRSRPAAPEAERKKDMICIRLRRIRIPENRVTPLTLLRQSGYGGRIRSALVSSWSFGFRLCSRTGPRGESKREMGGLETPTPKAFGHHGGQAELETSRANRASPAPCMCLPITGETQTQRRN